MLMHAINAWVLNCMGFELHGFRSCLVYTHGYLREIGCPIHISLQKNPLQQNKSSNSWHKHGGQADCGE